MLVCKYAVRKQKDNKTIKKIPEPNLKKKKKKDKNDNHMHNSIGVIQNNCIQNKSTSD